MRLWTGAMGALASAGVFGVTVAACTSPLGPTCGVDFNCADDAAADGAQDGMTSDGAGDANGDQSTTDGGGDGPSDAPMETTVSCDAAAAITCNGQCVDSTQPAHCGSCSNVCPAPTSGHGQATCTSPTCGLACNTGYTLCNGDCHDNTQEPSADACVVNDATGVFVSPGGNDTNACTKASPCKTIGKGLTIAKAANKRTYVCEGTYDEQLVVDATLDGAKVFGGFACSTWAYDVNKKPLVAPTARGYAMVISTPTSALFEDFAFQSQSGAAAGESSIAVFAKNAVGVVLKRCNVTAGAGVAGQDPTQPAPFGTAAPSGVNGTAVGGGTLVSNSQCSTSTGGIGGGPTPTGADGGDGTPGASNKGTVAACSGVAGAGGVVGSSGAGATTWAAFASSGWTPSPGSGGGPGTVAQGGGGGASQDLTGGAGSGGAGGCGGSGGGAGVGGGSSVAVLTFSSNFDVESCTLTAANAARGGNGAAGQIGQTGGTKGNGFANACQGGKGGNGGNGGTGGGGAGGLSAGIVWFGTAPTVNGAATPSAATLSGVTIGALGAGGTGATAGKAGVAAAVVQFQ